MAAIRPWSRGATRVTITIALAGIALAALLETRVGSPPLAPAAAAPPLLPPPGDTTVLYGPLAAGTVNGMPMAYVESFSFAPAPNRRRLLHIVQGSPPITGGGVVMNGWEVVSASELAAGGPINKVLQLRGEDTIAVSVSGAANANMTVSVLEMSDSSFIMFGPEHFVRTTGTPVTELRTFSIAPRGAPPYRLCLTNGEINGANRVSSATVLVNGQQVFVPSNFNRQVASLMANVSLHQAPNTLSVTLAGQPGGFVDICVTATDTTPPVIANILPPQNAAIGDTLATVSGDIDDDTPTTVTVNGQAAPLTGNHFSKVTLLPVEGHNTIHIVAKDGPGHVTDSARVLIRDTQKPVIVINQPADNSYTNSTTTTLSGTISDSTAVTLNVNGTPITVTNGAFNSPFTLAYGSNQLVFHATDQAGNTQDALRTVTRDTIKPVVVVSAPQENDTVITTSVAVSGTATDASPFTLTVNGNAVTPGQGGAFSTTVSGLVLGVNTITVVATDAATNVTPVTRHVIRKAPLPPDPATVASVVNRAEVTTIGSNTRFLYTGTDPIQTGVTGTIDSVRAAVVRGRVLDRAFQPLGGAIVKILNHAEFGQTKSRADGGYDLAVNGGSQLTISYALNGYFPAQRQVDVQWQDYTRVDDVILLRPDTVATLVTLNVDTPAVARSSFTQDRDTARQVTVLFKPGNSATITVPGGSPQPLTSFTVRATEFTVGDSGMLSMPADLPPASQYTYAVQISADTQIAAGPGTKITLAQPVPVYVSNFLKIPVGTNVPVGVYDGTTGAWIPKPNGIALKVLAPDANGRAQIDITGDGLADPPSALAALGIDDFELKRLAGLYQSGTDLWRALAPTFEPLDLNFPFVLVGSTPTDGKVKAGCSSREGDPLRCQLQAQTAFQQVGIVGSPFTLNYASDRTQGNVADRKLDITLTSATPPAQLIRVELEVDVAGQRFTGSFPNTANQHYTFNWDGHDLYGRLVQGTQPATVLIGYVFPVQYAAPPNAVDAFGLPCAPSGSGTICPFIAQGATPARAERTLVQRIETSIGTVDAAALGLGGFTLDVQNVYDPVGQVLYNGDGTRRAAAALPAGIRTVVGKPGSSIIRVVNHVPALSFGVTGGSGPIAAGPDGSIYFADGFQTLIQRLSPDGFVTTVAGKFPNSGAQCTGDNGSALSAGISFITGLAVASDGTIYFTDSGNCGQIRKVEPNGTMRHVAGKQASPGFTGDGGLADTARFQTAGALGLAPDGSLYLNDQGNRRIRRIAPDGIITTIAGDGTVCGPAISINTDATFNNVCKNGIAATKTKISSVQDLVVAPDGSIYISYLGRVRRITPDGILRTYAGNQDTLTTGDGGPATLAGIPGIWALARGPDGSIYVSQSVGNQTTAARIRRISSTGIITTFAGSGTPGFAGDGGPATAARIGQQVRGIAVGADGNLYISDFDNARVRKVAGILPGFGAGQTVIASEDGSELFVFSSAGRQQLTLRQLTGDTLYKFSYNDARQLVSVRDRFGLITEIQRDTTGKISGVMSPTGYHTSLVIGPNGELQGVTDPSGRTAHLVYGGGDLASSATDPNGFRSTYAFDSVGRLTSVVDPDSGFLNRTLTSSSRLEITSPTGSPAAIDVQSSSTGVLTQTGTLPGGTAIQSTTTVDDTTITVAPDGTRYTITRTPDPRFGMQVPLEQVVTRLPSGLQRSDRQTRTVQLSDSSNPLSLTTQIDSIIKNGRAEVQTYEKVFRRITTRSRAGRMDFTFFDSVGSRVRDSIPGFLARRYTLDGGGRLTQATQGSRIVRAFYGSNGLQDSTRDELGRITAWHYDSAGRSLLRIRPGGDTIQWAYDSVGNRTAVTPPGRPSHRFTYTFLRQRESYRPPPVASESSAVFWRYAPGGQLTQMLRPDGKNVSWVYDTAGRPLTTVFGADSITVGYDRTTGQATTFRGPSGELITQAYDGTLVTQRSWSGPVSGTVTAQYDTNFRVASLLVNGSAVASYGYDLDGAITSAGSLAITRDALTGLITSTSLGQITTSLTRSAFAEDSVFIAQVGSTVLLRWGFVRDDAGRVKTLTETLPSGTSTLQYSYDSTGRLASVTKNSVVVETYEYDQNGNRLRATYPSGQIGGSYDVQDRILSYGSAVYLQSAVGTVDGKIVGTDTTRYSFDALGQLRTVRLPNGTEVSYLYDASGRRVGRRVNGVLVQGFLYAGDRRPIAELDGAGSVVRRFVYATRADVPDFMLVGTETYRIIADPAGSVRLVINSQTGAIAQQIDYDAFGRQIDNSSPGFQPFGFAGGFDDPQTGLVQIGLRFYDAETGRWVSRDPILFDGGSSNLYTYAGSDPVNLADHTGAILGEIISAVMSDYLDATEKDKEVKRIKWQIKLYSACLNGMVDVAFEKGTWGGAEGFGRCIGNTAKEFAWDRVESIIGFGAVKSAWLQIAYKCMFGVYEKVILPDLVGEVDNSWKKIGSACMGGAVGQGATLWALSKNTWYGPLVAVFSKVLFHYTAKNAEAEWDNRHDNEE